MKQGMEIGELAKRAGVTRRTIRYYVALGLLPPGDERGRSRQFTERHLHRLHLIRQLKDQFLPLEEIGRRMAKLSDEEVERNLHNPEGPTDHNTLLNFSMMDERRTSLRILCQAPFPGGKPHGDRKRYSPSPPLRGELDQPESWRRLELLPGVELHISDQSTPSARHLVRQIRQLTDDFQKGIYREPETD